MSTVSGDGTRPESASRTAIAIVGVGCRFPGGVRDLASFGQLLARGGDALTDVPPTRWDRQRHQSGPEAISNPRGAFLEDIDRFDAPFFGISPREADLIDPQQRLVLEVAWEAMSDAGRTRESWGGSRTAVVLGMLAKDYETLHNRTLGARGIGQHHISGLEFSFAAGRLAYTFDLHGPVATVNSACSSSLLAVHQACQSLAAGECDTAVAGGVSLLLTPDISMFLSRVGALSPTGRCRPFDASADGIVRGEGAGIVVLKRLDDALTDGDRIHAVIRGSATNNDGRSMGLTVPNALAQADLLRLALERSGLAATDIDYVEAHGTGTPLGDVIEVDAIGEVYASGRSADNPLHIGSHKALVGHMDAAAGIGGLLKSTWIVSSGTIPAQPHVDSLNPGVNWRKGALTVPLDGIELPAGTVHRAGVSSFGLSGTNVHVVLESAPRTDPAAEAPRGERPHLLFASATEAPGLTAQVDALRALAEQTGEPDLADLEASTATRRSHESHRFAAVAADRAGLIRALRTDRPHEGVRTGVVSDPESVPAPVFVFTGESGPLPETAAALPGSDPLIRETLEECAELIRAEAGWSLTEALRERGPQPPSRTQPAQLAVQVALTRWFAARGVIPGAVVGSGLGEITAAHTAGVLTLEDAVRLTVRRAALLEEAGDRGELYAVTGGEAEVTALLAPTGLPVTVAAVNGPAHLVLAGPADALAEAAALLGQHGMRCGRLRVGALAHSPLLADLAPRLRAALDGLSPAVPTLRLLSATDPAGTPDFGPDHWARHLTSPGRLGEAVDLLLAEDDHPLVEITARPALLPALTEAQRLHGHRAPAVTALDRAERPQLALHKALAHLHVGGVPVRWEEVTGLPRQFRTLPVPSWGGGRYWLPGVERGEQGLTDPHPAPTAAGTAPAASTAPAGIRLSLLDAEGRVTGEMHALPTGTTPPATAPAAPAHPAPASAPGPVAATPPAARSVPLTQLVTRAVRELLGLPQGQAVPRRRGLFEQGLDSLSAMALRTRLEEELGVELPTTLIFERPTVNALAEYLGSLDLPAAPGPGNAEAAPAPAAVIPAPAAATRRADRDESAEEEGIAIVGVSCRLPGAASPEEFWDLLNDGSGTASAFPEERHADPIWSELGSAIPRFGSYLDDLAAFDAPFFRISPREAKLLDPQQRMFLEVAFEALEDAGCPAHTLAARPVGVYAGLSMADYQYLVARDMQDDQLNLYHGTGTSFAALAGRLSYILGLRGPSMTVDTACSASLTAVHLACQALRAGDCEVAVVGGASAIVAPSPLLASMAGSGALAPDGRCKSFDEEADGFGCGEGAVVLVLKPVSAAVRDADRIYAVVRGSAVNQDGASGGLTVPSAQAQTEVVRQAVARAGWSSHDIDYVETHGTGTPLGDPIEVRALADSLGGGRTADSPLLIGSAKANVGHLGAAAGAVGLLKLALAMRHRTLPPHLIAKPSSRIDWDQLPVRLATEAQPWPRSDRPARAGVSAFGFSGSNAHVVVEQYADPAPVPAPGGDHERVLLVTAATPAALTARARSMADHLRTAPDPLDDTVFTATHRRAALDHRLAVVGADARELATALAEAADGQPGTAAHLGHLDNDDDRSLAFRYGPELPGPDTLRRWSADPVYGAALDAYTARLAHLTGQPQDPYTTAPAALAPAVLFCHQAAATDCLRAQGLVPAAATGEGPGRHTAAWATGRLDTDAALRRLLDTTGPEADDAGDEEAAACDTLLDFFAEDLSPAHTAARLFAAGHQPVAPGHAGRRPVGLPGYPWEHQDYWYKEFTVPEDVAWPLSADSPERLRELAATVGEAVRGAGPATPAADVARALAERPAGAHRLVTVGRDTTELRAALREFAEQGTTGSATLVTRTAAAPRTALIFPGQGWQWAGMGAELLGSSPAFAHAVQECSAAIGELAGWSPLDVLQGTPDAPDFGRVDVVQPVMFTVMVGLARMWEAAGLEPAAVAGHSQGEIAAACVAGALSVPDAVRVVVGRSAAITELSGAGCMISVATGAEQLTAPLARWPERLWIAAVNGPGSTVVAGDNTAGEEFIAACTEQGIRARRIPVDYASHTPHVERIRTRILEDLAGITPRPARLPLYSTVTGQLLDTRTMDAEYWYTNLRRPVRFDEATRALLDDGITAFVESSAHPVLTPGIGETAETHLPPGAAPVTVTGTLRRGEGGVGRVHHAAAELWSQGADVDWTTLLPEGPRTPLPSPAPAAEETETATAREEKRFWRIVEREDSQELAALLGLDAAQGNPLESVLPQLSRWWQRHRENTVVNSWRYRVSWTPLTPPEEPRLTGTWLLAAPAGLGDHPHVTACLEALRTHGATARLLPVAAADTDQNDLLDALTQDGTPLSGVLSLLGLDESPSPDQPVVPAGLLATVRLLQAMEEAGCEARLWSATSGAVAAAPGEQLGNPLQAHLWGLNRVAGLENPHRFAGLLDLPPRLDTTARKLLCGALAGIGDEDQIALRAGTLLGRRLVRAPLADTTPARPWQPSGTTLITGGTGALGSHVARHLSRRGGHVLLLSRQGEQAPGAAELREELLGLGAASVTVTACDTADRDALRRTLDAIPAERPLTAVVHTAGVVDDGPVTQLTPSRLARVLLPKTQAVHHLHELTADLDLSAFVLYSSYGNLLPNVGQGAYAAGNAYLDAFAEHRRAQGLPATSVAWGAWAGKGMAEDPSFVDWLSRGGMDLMTPHLGVMALQQALDHDDTAIAIANVDWDRFAERFNATRPHPLVQDLVPAPAPAAAPAEDTGPAQLLALPEARRPAHLLDIVCTELATVLGYSGAAHIDPDGAFKELGIDSVTAIELRNRIAKQTGLRFSPIAVFDYPTSGALADHLLSLIPAGPGQAADAPDDTPAGADSGPGATPPPAEPSRIDAMAIEDLVRMARRAAPDGSTDNGS
ncbi:type I polyketide synthase [Streptomyces sp. SCSIO ZS0520]|uniref:type I polyketide synthase n=1 Tax=Streptomyces sp. SCSIO ZS0520 TaxID=2892996 RepID=UPI0021DA4490|nr:type I polyketide synthase [Streptomyces sp. SCSIO ZS0520]